MLTYYVYLFNSNKNKTKLIKDSLEKCQFIYNKIIENSNKNPWTYVEVGIQSEMSAKAISSVKLK